MKKTLNTNMNKHTHPERYSTDHIITCEIKIMLPDEWDDTFYSNTAQVWRRLLPMWSYGLVVRFILENMTKDLTLSMNRDEMAKINKCSMTTVGVAIERLKERNMIKRDKKMLILNPALIIPVKARKKNLLIAQARWERNT